MVHPRTRITVLISGNGSNLQAIIDAVKDNTLPFCDIVRVISNRKDAYGLVRAQNAGIPTGYHNLVKYKKMHSDLQTAREEYDRDLAALILEDKPHLVVCAGWMHILSPTFLVPLEKAGVAIINLHPALPGAYNGANAIERAHKDWMDGKTDKTGVMIHNVISEVDMGQPILVKEIPFVKGEDEDLRSLEQKIHSIEWKVIVEGTAMAIDSFWKTKEGQQSALLQEQNV